MAAGLICEVVMTFMFLIVILGATQKNAPAGFAPIAIGLGLTLIHLISIPVTNTSVNPARSTAVAIFQGSWAVQQLWLFLAGAADWRGPRRARATRDAPHALRRPVRAWLERFAVRWILSQEHRSSPAVLPAFQSGGRNAFPGKSRDRVRARIRDRRV